MPDITMCMNSSCAKRGDCYRYLAVPTGRWQSSTVFMPDKNGECGVFMEIRPLSIIRTLADADAWNNGKGDAK